MEITAASTLEEVMDPLMVNDWLDRGQAAEVDRGAQIEAGLATGRSELPQ